MVEIKSTNDYVIYKEGQELRQLDSNKGCVGRHLVTQGLHLNKYDDLCVGLSTYDIFCQIQDILVKRDISSSPFYSLVNSKPVFKAGDDIILKKWPDEKDVSVISAFLKKLYTREDYIKKIKKVIVKDGVVFYQTKQDKNMSFLDLSLLYRKIVATDKIDLKYLMNKVKLVDRKSKSNMNEINETTDLFLKNGINKISLNEKSNIETIKGNSKAAKSKLKGCMKNLAISLKKFNTSEDVMKVIFDKKDSKLSIYTPFIISELEKGRMLYPIGHYKFKVMLRGSSDNPFVYSAFRLEGPSAYRKAMHQCISSTGHICFGSFNIYDLSSSGKIFEVYLIFLNVLRNFAVVPDFNPLEVYDGFSPEFKRNTEHLKKRL